jgi:hypothetical protein
MKATTKVDTWRTWNFTREELLSILREQHPEIPEDAQLMVQGESLVVHITTVVTEGYPELRADR